MASRGFDIDNFKAAIEQNGLLSNDKFLVEITPPPGLSSALTVNASDSYKVSTAVVNNPGSTISGTARILELFCDSACIPGVALNTTPNNRYGYASMEPMVMGVVFTPCSFTFYSDASGAIYNFFQSWLKLACNFDARTGLGAATGIGAKQQPYEITYKSEYVSTVTIHILDRAGNEPLMITLRDAFPILVNDIPLAWAGSNSIMKVSVAFVYTDWYPGPLITNRSNTSAGE